MSYYQPLSYWEKDAYFGHTNIAIIGGGIVGMNAALRLKEARPKCTITIVDRSSIGTAASSRNAGFACYGSISEIYADLESMPDDDVYNLVRNRVEGLTLLKRIVGEQQLRYARTGGHEVFLDREQFDFHLDKLTTINKLIETIDPELKFYYNDHHCGLQNVAGVISNEWEGQVHPGYMMAELRRLCVSSGIRLLTNFNVDRIEEGNDYHIHSESLSLSAGKIVICNNAFAKDLVDVETSAGRNQVLLTNPIKNLPVHGCYHYDQGYVYFRNVGDRLLIGGGRNRFQETETTDQFGQTVGIRSYLIEIIERHILINRPYHITEEWSGILGFNKTKQPIIKEVSNGKFVAVGLGGMGVAMGTLVGQQVADLLLQS